MMSAIFIIFSVFVILLVAIFSDSALPSKCLTFSSVRGFSFVYRICTYSSLHSHILEPDATYYYVAEHVFDSE